MPDEDEPVNPRKRKRASEKEKAKAKAKKPMKAGSDDDFEDDFGDAMYQKSRPTPGQLENCEVCNKRFTVTPYSKTGADGGLLCTPCGKELTKETKAADNKVKRAGTGKKRRTAESNRLDGIVRLGPKPLQDLCIDKVAQHHLDIEEFGDLPDSLVDRLSQIFSKRRVLDPRTLKLFLRPDLDTVAIHDAANLGADDFQQIFAVCPNVKKLVLRNAGQFKDSVLEYMTEKAPNISHLQIYGANLITDSAWQTFFTKYGGKLKAVMIEWCDASFTDDVVETLAASCPNLQRLKLKFCRKITPASLPSLSQLKKLEQLSIRLATPPESAELIAVVSALGPQLKTLSFENCPDADDSFVDEIRLQCKSLRKLRLSGIECITDAALASLFSSKTKKATDEASVIPMLSVIDLSAARDVDSSNPKGPEDVPIGLGAESFKTMMAHSGPKVQTLDIASCRHIPHAAFCDVFNPTENQYPELHTINVTFCSGVDTAIIKGIFACCPKLRKIIAFGCFKIEDIVVPTGVALIGVPRAQDAIENIGEAGMDLDKALGFMGELVSAAA